MLSRRDLIGTCLGSIVTIVASSRTVKASSYRGGCVLDNEAAARYLASYSELPTGNEPIYSQSGMPSFDFALAQSLRMISGTLDVLPGFGFFDDSESPNAYFTSLRRTRNPNGTVLIGRRMLHTLLDWSSGDVSVLTVAAHEFGHAVQSKWALWPYLTGPTVKRRELHADFLAGFFAGVRQRVSPTFPAETFVETLHAMGDPWVNDVDHHGTPAERATAVASGISCAGRCDDIQHAARRGIEFVHNL